MAFLNELEPNTTNDHQGRLAYVPDDLLPKTITSEMFAKAQENSLVLRLGRRIPVSFGETVIPVNVKRPEVGQVGTGTTNAQREGGTKPLSGVAWEDRKSTRLNSSHSQISYAVFCLKKKTDYAD